MGGRLRALRTRKGISLREVADKCGVSISFLSLLERGLTNVAIDKLQRIAMAYGTTIGELVAPEVDIPQRRVKPAGRPYLEAAGVRIENLSAGLLQIMEPQLFTIAPGAGSEEAYVHDGEEFLFVIEGSLDIWLDEKEHYKLEVGNSLYFPSSTPHTWVNLGKEASKVLWVNSPPTF